MSQLEFQNVFFQSEDKQILQNISITIDTGDYISIVGPSGSGKSTFLKLCCHLISPTDGKIQFNGTDIMSLNPVELRKRISYCFQTPVLFGDTVQDNLIYPYTIRNLSMDSKRVNELFAKFNLSMDFLGHEVKNLSGGEKQRIALIRTLLFKPEVLLLDEVTSALDVENTGIVEKGIQSLNQEGITVLWVTHSPEQSKKYANKLLTIEDGKIKSLEVLK